MKNYKQYVIETAGIIHLQESAESIVFPYVRGGKLLNIKEWVESGGDINIRNDISNGNTFTPLMQSVADQFTEDKRTTKFIIDLGADLNIKDNWGRTALWYAAYNGHHHSAIELLIAGADPYPKDVNGKDFYDVLPDNESLKQAFNKWLQENNPVYIRSKRFDL